MANANLKNEKFFLRLIRDGKLKVTKSGRAFNLVTGREIGKARPGFNSYRKLSWMHPKTRKIVQIQLHRIVWSSVNGIPEDPDLIVNHIDGYKPNCRLSNLELTDDAGNAQHAITTGLNVPKKAEENGNAVFTNGQIRGLRRKFAQGLIDVKYITEKYSVSKFTANALLKAKTYPSVKSKYTRQCQRLLAQNKDQEKKDRVQSLIPRMQKLRRLGYTSYAISKKLKVSDVTVRKYY